jgi:uncharacterized protein YwlG (UPF0340 family)
MNAVNIPGGANRIAARSVGSAMSAVQTLVRSTQAIAGGALKTAKAPFPKLVGDHRAQEIAFAKIGPQSIRKI